MPDAVDPRVLEGAVEYLRSLGWKVWPIEDPAPKWLYFMWARSIQSGKMGIWLKSSLIECAKRAGYSPEEDAGGPEGGT